MATVLGAGVFVLRIQFVNYSNGKGKVGVCGYGLSKLAASTNIKKGTICHRSHLPPVLFLSELFNGLNLMFYPATEQLGSD